MSFPENGLPESEVWSLVQARLASNTHPQKNWATYGPEAHPFAKKVFSLPEAIDSYAVEFYRDVYPGTAELAQETVRMLGSLLGADDAAGFITTGGTEANLMAVRLARNLGRKLRKTAKPEIVVPHSRHYSLDLAAELFGVKLRLVEVTREYRPRMNQVSRLIGPNTVAVFCSAPEAYLGGIDSVEAFAKIAARFDLYLHVDAAVGGFALPFLARLGRPVPAFAFDVPQVMSITIDPHKLGLCPRPTGALILRDTRLLEIGVEIEKVVIDTLSASGRPGSSVAALWAMIKHLGADGYTEFVRHQFELVDYLVKSIEDTPGLRLMRRPDCNIVCFTTTAGYDIEEVARGLWQRGYVVPLNPHLPYDGLHLRLYVHPLKTPDSAQALVADLREAAIDARRRRQTRPGEKGDPVGEPAPAGTLRDR